jgi:transcriptional regulator with XRE-family HTH domain
MSDTGHAARARRSTTVLDGQRLRELRREHSLSQDKLAALAGVSLTTVVRLDPASRSHLAALAHRSGSPLRSASDPPPSLRRLCRTP